MTPPATFLLLTLALIYGLALWQIWRSPFRALGVLVAGMAFHNFGLMIMLRLGTPATIVRILQSWKEGILLLLLLLALIALVNAWRARRLPRPARLDLVFGAFAVVVLIYTALPPGLLHGNATAGQRLLGARVLLLLPLLYAFGRTFRPRTTADLRWVGWVILGSAAAVGVFGLVELWLVPTTQWFSWGVNQLSAWLGFRYTGPGGLPENFFQTTLQGYLLRRMVSTYVSPLGIAYAGLVVVPLAVMLMLALIQRRLRALAFMLLALTIASVLFSLTRLALLMMVAELLILALLTRRRWVLYATPVVALLSAFMIFEYVNVGPLVTRNLVPITQRPANLSISSSGDPSLREHSGMLAYDIQYVFMHPLGTGVGSSIHRFGPTQGTGESAILAMFGDLGLIGGGLYLLMYGLPFVMAVAVSIHRRADPTNAVLPVTYAVAAAGLASITATTDLWGDLATTYLFWWAAGNAVSLFRQESSRSMPAAGRSSPRILSA